MKPEVSWMSWTTSENKNAMHIRINTSIRPITETPEGRVLYIAVAMQSDHPDYRSLVHHNNCIIGRFWAETPTRAVSGLLPLIDEWMENPNRVELPLEEFVKRERSQTRTKPPEPT